jgi:hypothetical protein
MVAFKFLMTRPLVKYGALAACLLVMAVLAVAAFTSMQVPFKDPTAGGSAPVLNCSPAPCANLQGYTLWVANLRVKGDLVEMQILFKNSSGSTHASPEDLQLFDARQHGSGLVTDAPDCKTWSRHEFNNGARFGPLTVCFRIGSPTPPLVLRWSPDLGLICCTADIKVD